MYCTGQANLYSSNSWVMPSFKAVVQPHAGKNLQFQTQGDCTTAAQFFKITSIKFTRKFYLPVTHAKVQDLQGCKNIYDCK